MALDPFLKWITNSNTAKYPSKQATTELHKILRDLESSKPLFNKRQREKHNYMVLMMMRCGIKEHIMERNKMETEYERKNTRT